MQKLSWVIENEINFGNSMKLFKLQISDAIFYYQSNSESINGKLSSIGCASKITKSRNAGKKKLILIQNKLKLFRHNSIIMGLNKKLSDLFSDISKNYVGLANFWNSLTVSICKSISGNHEKCWNGVSLSK
jgi:hypothetical protein